MTVQEYGLKFTQLSRYSPHMVADSRTQMNKFLYGVSDLVKTKCRNAMLLENMNISRLMTHAQQVERDKLREQAKENKRLEHATMSILNRSQVVEIARSSSKVFSSSTFISHLPGFDSHASIPLASSHSPVGFYCIDHVISYSQVQVLSIQITYRSVPDLQFSSISGESSILENDRHVSFAFSL
ncbi:hypothetical protein MTR67_052986 [Solanum verrucosum]|uniref:Gag-pol polyprotein n=1 Tax=Solanum verrucosum TaxID=315347 RepID=A0AAF0V9W9_SOLVR|nr:hypothetical protein MTR67_052986 [Solanum verrucosum]